MAQAIDEIRELHTARDVLDEVMEESLFDREKLGSIEERILQVMEGAHDMAMQKSQHDGLTPLGDIEDYDMGTQRVWDLGEYLITLANEFDNIHGADNLGEIALLIGEAMAVEYNAELKFSDAHYRADDQTIPIWKDYKIAIAKLKQAEQLSDDTDLKVELRRVRSRFYQLKNEYEEISKDPFFQQEEAFAKFQPDSTIESLESQPEIDPVADRIYDWKSSGRVIDNGAVKYTNGQKIMARLAAENIDVENVAASKQEQADIEKVLKAYKDETSIVNADTISEFGSGNYKTGSATLAESNTKPYKSDKWVEDYLTLDEEMTPTTTIDEALEHLHSTDMGVDPEVLAKVRRGTYFSAGMGEVLLSASEKGSDAATALYQIWEHYRSADNREEPELLDAGDVAAAISDLFGDRVTTDTVVNRMLTRKRIEFDGDDNLITGPDALKTVRETYIDTNSN